MSQHAITDLSSIDVAAAAEEGYKLIIKHPLTGKPIEFGPEEDRQQLWIKLRGIRSDRMQRFINNRINADLQKTAKGKVEPMTAEDIRRRQTDMFVEATMDWNLPPVDGKILSFNERNARMIYEDLRFPFIREQVDKTLGDEDPFLQSLQKSSNSSPSEPSS